MTMAGQAVYRWATTKLTDTLVEAMRRRPASARGHRRLRPAPGQPAHRRVDDQAARLPESTVIARDIVLSGNTSAASVPLALSALMESGEAKRGDVALVLGYGAGLTFAGQVVVMP